MEGCEESNQKILNENCGNFALNINWKGHQQSAILYHTEEIKH